jgi:hypothetical protein
VAAATHGKYNPFHLALRRTSHPLLRDPLLVLVLQIDAPLHRKPDWVFPNDTPQDKVQE